MAITRLDSRTIEVDDAHPFVFTSGSWRQITIEGLFNNTVSYSSQAGDRKVVRFVGTSITVRGGLQQYSGNGLTNNPPLSSFSVDDGPTVTFSAQSPPRYTAVSYYQSSQLTMGEHVLTMTNAIDNDIVHIDAFIIQSPEGQTPEILPSDGSSIPDNPSPPSPNSPSSRPGSALSVPSVSSTGTLPLNTGTSIRAGLATTTASGFRTVTVSHSASTGYQTTILSAQPSADQPPTQGSTTINYQTDLTSPPNQKPVIAAAVLGGLVFITLGVGLAFLIRRRRRRRQQLAPSAAFPYSQSPQPFDIIPNEPLPHYERHQTPSRMLGPNTPDPLRPGTPESTFSDMIETTTEKKDLGDVGYPAYHHKGARMTMESNVSGKEFGHAL